MPIHQRAAFGFMGTFFARGTLYNDVNNIPLYKDHRDTLRPWDRPLPSLVELEFNRRQMWTLKPPKGWQIAMWLIICVATYQLIALLPLYVNWDNAYLSWRDIKKPGIVYENTKVLMAGWIVVHVCTGLALWFVWLTGGWQIHLGELVPLFLASAIECLWLDIVFVTRRLDWVLWCWEAILGLIVVAQVLLILNRVRIAALFLLPHIAGGITIIVYTLAFISLSGNEWTI